MSKQISVIGLGYIGLPTSVLLASKKYKIKASDINEEVVQLINEGKVHISEPGLDHLLKEAISRGFLEAYRQIQKSDIYIICVPTPFNKSTEIPSPDLSHIENVTAELSLILKPGDLVILESTSPVGTTEMIGNQLKENGVNIEEISIAYCPERVIPGNIMEELVGNDRIVGGLNLDSTKKASDFYRSFVNGNVIETDSKTAELCKLTENSFRDVNIAFANELSMICENYEIDTRELIEIANLHPRVNILDPGIGVGGHCIAVDPWFIISDNLEDSKLIKTSREVNLNKTDWVIKKIIERAEYLKTKNIACLGLTYKPDVDDIRESPAIDIVKSLRDYGLNVLCVDPNLNLRTDLGLFSLEEVYDKCDHFVILVSHKEFKSEELFKKLKDKEVQDFC